MKVFFLPPEMKLKGEGILLGILIGNALSLLIETIFIIPLSWTIPGVAFVFYWNNCRDKYPEKAVRPDPIAALGYE